MELYIWQEHKFKQVSFLLDIRKKFFTVRAVKHWSRLPREMGESLYSVVFKTQVYKALCNQFSIQCHQPCFEQRIWLLSPKLFCDSIDNHFNKFCYVSVKVDLSPTIISCARSGKSCVG